MVLSKGITLLSKKIVLNKNFLCKWKKVEKNSIIIFFFSKNSLFLKINLRPGFILNNNNLYFFNDKCFFSVALSFYKSLFSSLRNICMLHYSFFVKLNVIGLGYKNFVLQNQLFLLLGDCNYIVLDIPTTVKVFCKKKQIYLFGVDRNVLFNFANRIKLIKTINYYKGKGILEFKNFKFMKLKTGKKQRFM